MKRDFLDRADEKKRLNRAMRANGGAFAVVYGRRRCGKSTLIQQVIADNDLYYLADQKEPRLQIGDLAVELDRLIPGFSSATYGAWDALLNNLNHRLRRPMTLCLDEFPYLVQGCPELPSVLQKFLDLPDPKNVNLVVCGSSQRMMHGLVMDQGAPLYGRAVEILKVRPLKAGWIREGLGLKGEDAVEAFSVWGGVPRYWELAAPFRDLAEGIRELVLAPNGVLHEEPMRLLLDDMRSGVQPYSLLSLVGQGCHRLSEIAGRLGKPASSLMRPLLQLVDLGYVDREVPFGENNKSSRRSLYTIRDPFLRFYFGFLQPNRSQLEVGAVSSVLAKVRRQFPLHVSSVWAALARDSVPLAEIGGQEWGPACRWWGPSGDGTLVEFDVVAESADGKSVLVGEAKWNVAESQVAGARERLLAQTKLCPFVHGRKVVPAVWVRRGRRDTDVCVLTPNDVLDSLM